MYKNLSEFYPHKTGRHALIDGMSNRKYLDEDVLRCVEKLREESEYDRLDTDSEPEPDSISDSEAGSDCSIFQPKNYFARSGLEVASG